MTEVILIIIIIIIVTIIVITIIIKMMIETVINKDIITKCGKYDSVTIITKRDRTVSNPVEAWILSFWRPRKVALADHFIDYQWGKTDHKYSGRGGMQFIGIQGGVGDRLFVGREVVVVAHSTD